MTFTEIKNNILKVQILEFSRLTEGILIATTPDCVVLVHTKCTSTLTDKTVNWTATFESTALDKYTCTIVPADSLESTTL